MYMRELLLHATRKNSLQFPVGCPLRNYTHCSVPTPLRAPDLSIENETGLLLFSATALEKGISLCTSISNESFSLREAHVAVVKSVHFPSLKVFHQLLVSLVHHLMVCTTIIDLCFVFVLLVFVSAVYFSDVYICM